MKERVTCDDVAPITCALKALQMTKALRWSSKYHTDRTLDAVVEHGENVMTSSLVYVACKLYAHGLFL